MFLIYYYFEFFIEYGAPERIRTSGLWFRKPTLYPPELRAQNTIKLYSISLYKEIHLILITKPNN